MVAGVSGTVITQFSTETLDLPLAAVSIPSFNSTRTVSGPGGNYYGYAYIRCTTPTGSYCSGSGAGAVSIITPVGNTIMSASSATSWILGAYSGS